MQEGSEREHCVRLCLDVIQKPSDEGYVRKVCARLEPFEVLGILEYIVAKAKVKQIRTSKAKTFWACCERRLQNPRTPKRVNGETARDVAQRLAKKWGTP